MNESTPSAPAESSIPLTATAAPSIETPVEVPVAIEPTVTENPSDEISELTPIHEAEEASVRGSLQHFYERFHRVSTRATRILNDSNIKLKTGGSIPVASTHRIVYDIKRQCAKEALLLKMDTNWSERSNDKDPVFVCRAEIIDVLNPDNRESAPGFGKSTNNGDYTWDVAQTRARRNALTNLFALAIGVDGVDSIDTIEPIEPTGTTGSTGSGKERSVLDDLDDLLPSAAQPAAPKPTPTPAPASAPHGTDPATEAQKAQYARLKAALNMNDTEVVKEIPTSLTSRGGLQIAIDHLRAKEEQVRERAKREQQASVIRETLAKLPQDVVPKFEQMLSDTMTKGGDLNAVNTAVLSAYTRARNTMLPGLTTPATAPAGTPAPAAAPVAGRTLAASQAIAQALLDDLD